VLEASAFTVNEAALTGEPYGVIKRPGEVKALTPSEANNALFRRLSGISCAGWA
jgi:Mg2+-importing ATPase